jgi:uncharacterized iron-regulated protein
LAVRVFFVVISCWITFLVFGCAGKRPISEPVVARIPDVSGVFHRGQVIDLASGKDVSFDRLMDQASSRDVIFVGEIHDDPAHHLIETQILQGLFARDPSLTMAMEFFQQDQQAILDGYTMGDMTEEEFLNRVDWKKTWGYPYFYYRPLMLLAKQHRLKVLALNAPGEIVRKVAREGLSALDAEQRAQLPVDIGLTNEAERAYVRDAYGEHEHGNLQSFQFFYEAQCVWEETMAGHIADYMKDHRQKVIVFSGNGHIIWKFGIPDRTQRQIPVSTATIMCYPLLKTVTLERGIADYLWLTAP